MHDIMVVYQELCADEVRLSKSAPSAVVAPVAVAPAVADRAIVPTFDDVGVEPEPFDEKKHVAQSVGRPICTILAVLCRWFVHCPPLSWRNRWLYFGDVAIHPQSRRHRDAQSQSA